MEKEIRISMRINKELKETFFQLCESRQQTPSKVIKYLMEQYIKNSTTTNK